MRKRLSDLTIAKMKPPATGRTETFDDTVKALAVRVTSMGAKSFTLRGRIKGNATPIRLTIGSACMKIADARDIAREMLAQMAKGDDPRAIIAAKKAAAPVKIVTFKTVAEAYIKQHVSPLRSGKLTEAEIKRHLVTPLGTMPITDITDVEVKAAIVALVDAGYKATASRVLGYAKTLFTWACEPGNGLKINPTIGLKKKSIVGKLEPRSVTLSNDNLRNVWNAAGALAEPFGLLVKMLILSGQRLREVAEMEWSEIDFAEKVWIIPASRMKGKRAHEVPLAPAMLKILTGLQAHRGSGLFVFSTTKGKRPVSGFSKIKAKLDEKIEEKLDADAEPLPAWRFHDLRRTMRTGLGAISTIPHDVAERVIAHAQSGISQVYNLHSYRAEKLHALEAWGVRLVGIVNPPESNIVALRA